ncbi:hypothetical protein CWI38_1581p0020 [Hamiltosporidium tvaerminnensis]|uniref:Uncharacterized protein n=1 Tax=Hamiltosporidium tvaerminnensis TaxID=1176355 RepID=A0A4Q9LSM7_9MICR|nr:hypothetical protein CWI38_1581p0020 [Hamiltosporidium tvaerminnensis]
MDRLKFCSSKVNLANNGDLLFDNLYDYVHIDENKRFITKIMFMTAIFVYQEPAQINSKNRAKKTMITKNLESVTAVHCKNMIIDNVIPAIKSKFPPVYKKKTIYVQQDNAKPHFSDNDAYIVALGSANNWNIKSKAQPANSPDLNVLDLADGGNGYKIPYLSKRKLRREDRLLEKYLCSKEVYNKSKSNFE